WTAKLDEVSEVSFTEAEKTTVTGVSGACPALFAAGLVLTTDIELELLEQPELQSAAARNAAAILENRFSLCIIFPRRVHGEARRFLRAGASPEHLDDRRALLSLALHFPGTVRPVRRTRPALLEQDGTPPAGPQAQP